MKKEDWLVAPNGGIEVLTLEGESLVVGAKNSGSGIRFVWISKNRTGVPKIEDFPGNEELSKFAEEAKKYFNKEKSNV